MRDVLKLTISKSAIFSLWFIFLYSHTTTKGPRVWRRNYSCLIVHVGLLSRCWAWLLWSEKQAGKSLEDEASPESSQMCTVLAGPLSLPENPFTAKTIAYILKWNSECFFCSDHSNSSTYFNFKNFHLFF